MKTKTLSQLELATIAASLPSGSAQERVKLALEIWQEAEAETAGTASNVARRMENNHSLAADPVPLDWILADLMPKTPPAKRRETWFNFSRWTIEHDSGRRPTTSEVESLLDIHEREGVPDFLKASETFRTWDAEKRAEIAREKASKAARSRWDQKPENHRKESKAGGKTNQIKKRAKN